MNKIVEAQNAELSQKVIDKSMAEASKMLDKVKEMDKEFEESKA